MKKHKNKIIAAVVIVAVLAGAWFWGGNYNRGQGSVVSGQETGDADRDQGSGVRGQETGDADRGQGSADSEIRNSEFGIRNEEPDSITIDGKENQYEQTANMGSAGNQNIYTPNSQEPTREPETPELSISDSEVIIQNSKESTGDAAYPNQEIPDSEFQIPDSQDSETPAPTMDIVPETGVDKYQTSQAPEGKPAPVEPQDVTVGDGSFTVTLSVRCDMILNNMNLLNKEKHELVPADGVIFPATIVTAYEGESVFNVLYREMRRAGIHMQYRNTPIYNSAYLEAINNLYEFDVGELSGWMYKVNGWFPNYGSSRYQLQPGDVIEWHYTCDLGRDLGEYGLGAGWGQLDD